MYLCSVGIAFGHWPGTVHVTSVKEKTHPSSSLSSLVLHVSSVSLSVCFVSAHAVLLTYSRCCQSTSKLKRKRDRERERQRDRQRQRDRDIERIQTSDGLLYFGHRPIYKPRTDTHTHIHIQNQNKQQQR